MRDWINPASLLLANIPILAWRLNNWQAGLIAAIVIGAVIWFSGQDTTTHDTDHDKWSDQDG